LAGGVHRVRPGFHNDIDAQLVVRDTQEPELKRAALTADYATVLNEAMARSASETEDALHISAAAGTPSLTAGGSAQQNQGSSRCGTPPAASAGSAQSGREPRQKAAPSTYKTAASSAEGRLIAFLVNEHRHMPVEIRHLAILFPERARE
jgi:hypothetical protein